MKAVNILIPMNLAGQADRRRRSEAGYAMAALLVALSIMAVMLSVAMPVWNRTAQREKEEELVFRGLQYVHAIGLFQRKFANAYPPNVDVLVQQRFLRRKFKDPITNDDFVVIPVGQGLPGSAPQLGEQGAQGTNPGGSQARAGSTSGGSAPATGQRGLQSITTQRGGPGGTGIQTTAGIVGVTSKSKDTSIRIYNGRTHYNEWAFVYTPQLQAGQGAVPGTSLPGQRSGPPGQRGGPPGQRGQSNDPFGGRRGERGNNPFGPGNSPDGGRFGPGPQRAEPIFGPQPTPRGRQ
jgi:type II secretory pathway pseudopilin PulG